MNYAGNATLIFSLSVGMRLGFIETYCCGYRGEDGESRSAYWPHTAYFCRRCGAHWASATFSYEFIYDPVPEYPWIVIEKCCEACGDGLFLGERDLAGASEELLKREVDLLLRRQDYGT